MLFLKRLLSAIATQLILRQSHSRWTPRLANYKRGRLFHSRRGFRFRPLSRSDTGCTTHQEAYKRADGMAIEWPHGIVIFSCILANLTGRWTASAELPF